MQLFESGSHSFPPPSGSGSYRGPGSLGWAPPPSPFSSEPRRTSEISQHSNSYPTRSHEKTYTSQVPYGSKAGSISPPARPPVATVQAHVQHVIGSSLDGPCQSQQGPSDRGGYVHSDVPPNGDHPTDLPIVTNQEVIPGHHPFWQTLHAPYSHPQLAGPASGLGPIYDPYYQVQHWYNPDVTRKKPGRAQQACDSCRTRKAKCDELQPCSHCKDNQLNCKYSEVPSNKQDRKVLALEAKMDSMPCQLRVASFL